MTNEELVWDIAYGADGEAIPDELQGSDPTATLFKMIRVLARELARPASQPVTEGAF